MISFWKHVAAEDFVEHDFAVVDFAVVDVEEEGAGGGEDAVGFDHARAEECRGSRRSCRRSLWPPVCCGEDLGAVAMAAEAYAVAGFVADGLHLRFCSGVCRC